MHSERIISKKTDRPLYIIVLCFKPMSRFNENKVNSNKIYIGMLTKHPVPEGNTFIHFI